MFQINKRHALGMSLETSTRKHNAKLAEFSFRVFCKMSFFLLLSNVLAFRSESDFIIFGPKVDSPYHTMTEPPQI